MHHFAQLLFLIPTLQRYLSWAQERRGQHSHAERGHEKSTLTWQLLI
jgi:hypothetical protein